MNELAAALDALSEPEGDDFWANRRRDLRRAAQNENLDRFLNWSTIRGTMFVGTGAPWTKAELAYLQAQPDWRQVWQPAMVDAPAGHPELIPGTHFSGNTVEQAYHLCLWQNATGLKIRDLTSIVEVGGGYGAMRYLAYRLGFGGDYVLYDSPEYLELQRYYLRQVGLPAHFIGENSLPAGTTQEADLLIGICSLSEMPFNDRSAVLARLPARHYLLRYQRAFEGYQNNDWFKFWFEVMLLARPTYLPGPEFLDHTYLIT